VKRVEEEEKKTVSCEVFVRFVKKNKMVVEEKFFPFVKEVNNLQIMIYVMKY